MGEKIEKLDNWSSKDSINLVRTPERENWEQQLSKKRQKFPRTEGYMAASQRCYWELRIISN